MLKVYYYVYSRILQRSDNRVETMVYQTSSNTTCERTLNEVYIMFMIQISDMI